MFLGWGGVLLISCYKLSDLNGAVDWFFQHLFTWLSPDTLSLVLAQNWAFFIPWNIGASNGASLPFCCSFPSVWLWPTSCQVLNWAERDSRAPNQFFGGNFVHAFLTTRATRAIPHPDVFILTFIFCWGAPVLISFPRKFIFRKYSTHTHTRGAGCPRCCKPQHTAVRPKFSIFLLFCSQRLHFKCAVKWTELV